MMGRPWMKLQKIGHRQLPKSCISLDSQKSRTNGVMTTVYDIGGTAEAQTPFKYTLFVHIAL